MRPKATARVPLPPPTAVMSVPASQPEHAAEADVPIGWVIDKQTWHFHRRFHLIFKRTMAYGEYSHLLKQIRRSEAEHLGDNAWRVTLLDGRTTLPVRGHGWRLDTILPKDWQPPARPASAHPP